MIDNAVRESYLTLRDALPGIGVITQQTGRESRSLLRLLQQGLKNTTVCSLTYVDGLKCYDAYA